MALKIIINEWKIINEFISNKFSDINDWKHKEFTEITLTDDELIIWDEANIYETYSLIQIIEGKIK